MKIHTIDFEQTHQFSRLFLDYVHQKPQLRPFYSDFPTLENTVRHVEKKQFSAEKRAELVEAFHRQYQTIENPPLQQINTLLNENTYTVTTGHQLCIYTGTLFFIYKIVTTIRLAEELSRYDPSRRFVPVFWMASEDHDFAEINHFYLFGKKYEWHPIETRGAVGKLNPSLLAQIAQEVREIPELFRDFYANSTSLAEATRKILHHLFGNRGLLVIDGDDVQLKRSLRAIAADDLTNHSIKNLVERTNASLSSHGYDAQIYVREINFFYLDNFLRERIERVDDSYRVLNTSLNFSKEDILALLEARPEKFSPNVATRPLYQELVLPNLAYVGGPAEVTYWLQLKAVFDYYQITFPLIFPRNFAMIFTPLHTSKLTKLSLEAQDLFLNEPQLKNVFLTKNAQKRTDFSEAYQRLEQLTQHLAQLASSVDKSLDGFVRAEMKHVLKTIEAIEKRVKKAEENQHEVSFKQLFSLKEKLFPNGVPQERHDNYLQFLANDEQFLEKLFTIFHPFSFQYYLLSYP